MKKIASLFMVAVFAGALTLGAYKLFFEKQNFALVTENQDNQTLLTNYSPTSNKGSGIDEVDFTLAAQNTVNAVVHVKNMSISSGPVSLSDLFYGSGQGQRAQVGSGSGVIITPDGYIVSNNHVVANATRLQVTLNNNKTYDAELVGSDPKTDIALLKIDAEEQLPYLTFGDSDDTKIGEWVLAVGNPFNLTSTVTAGIVSAKARNLGKGQSFIQTDAAVNPGNSGGALVNTDGQLVGINTAITSQTGSYVGYSFAVPSNIAKKVVDDLSEFGNVKKGVLGIQSFGKNTRYAVEQGLNEIDGVYVSGVEDESGAQDAGLKEGDIIKKVDRIKVRNFPDLTGYVSSKRPGDKIDVAIERDGEQLVLPVTLKEAQTLIVENFGFEVKNLTKKEKRNFDTENGVIIRAVPLAFNRYDLVGKVIIEVDGQDIKNIKDAKILFEQISKYGDTSITLLNEDGERERLIFQ